MSLAVCMTNSVADETEKWICISHRLGKSPACWITELAKQSFSPNNMGKGDCCFPFYYLFIVRSSTVSKMGRTDKFASSWEEQINQWASTCMKSGVQLHLLLMKAQQNSATFVYSLGDPVTTRLLSVQHKLFYLSLPFQKTLWKTLIFSSSRKGASLTSGMCMWNGKPSCAQDSCAHSLTQDINPMTGL